jgi:hypothetical protein
MEIRIHSMSRPTFDKSRTMRMIRITCGDQGEMTVRLTGVSRFP